MGGLQLFHESLTCPELRHLKIFINLMGLHDVAGPQTNPE